MYPSDSQYRAFVQELNADARDAFLRSVAAVPPEQQATYRGELARSMIKDFDGVTQEAAFEAITDYPEDHGPVLDVQNLAFADQEAIKGFDAKFYFLRSVAAIPPDQHVAYRGALDATIKSRDGNTQTAVFAAIERNPEKARAFLDAQNLAFADQVEIKGVNTKHGFLRSVAAVPPAERIAYRGELDATIKDCNEATQMAAFLAIEHFPENRGPILDAQNLAFADQDTIKGFLAKYRFLRSVAAVSPDQHAAYRGELDATINSRDGVTQSAAFQIIEHFPENRGPILDAQNLAFADHDKINGVNAKGQFLRSVAAVPLEQHAAYRGELESSTIEECDGNTQAAAFEAITNFPEKRVSILDAQNLAFADHNAIKGLDAKWHFLKSAAAVPPEQQAAYRGELATQCTKLHAWDGDRQATFFKLLSESPESRERLMGDSCVQYMTNALKQEQDDLRTFSELPPVGQQQRLDAVALQKYQQDGLPISAIMKKHFAKRESAFFNAALGLHAEEERKQLLDSSEMQSLAFHHKSSPSFGTRTRKLLSSSSKEQEGSLASYKGLYAHYYHSDDAETREKAEAKLGEFAHSALEPWRKGGKEQKQLERYIRGGLAGTTFAPKPENMPEGLAFDLPFDFFGQFNYLKEVNLSGTDLRKVEPLLHGLGELKDLKTLTMRGCQLTSFPENIELPPGCDVDLSDNPELPRSVLESLKRKGNLKAFDRNVPTVLENFAKWVKEGPKERRDVFQQDIAEHVEAINNHSPNSEKLILKASRNVQVRDLPPDFWPMVLHENLREIDLSGHLLGEGKYPVDLSLIPFLAPKVTSVNLSGNGLTREKVAGLKQWSENAWDSGEANAIEEARTASNTTDKGKGKAKATQAATGVGIVTAASSADGTRKLDLTGNAFTQLPYDIEHVSSNWTVDMTNNRDLETLAKLQSQLVNHRKRAELISTDVPSDTASVHSWKFPQDTYENLTHIGEHFRATRQRLQTIETKLTKNADSEITPIIQTQMNDLREKEDTFATHKYAKMLETVIHKNERMSRYFKACEQEAMTALDSGSSLHGFFGRANPTMGTAPELQTKKTLAHGFSVAANLGGGLAGTAVSALVPVPIASGLVGGAVTSGIGYVANYPESRVDKRSEEMTNTFIDRSRSVVQPHERLAFSRAMAMGMAFTRGEQFTDADRQADPGAARETDLSQAKDVLKRRWQKLRGKPDKESPKQPRADRDVPHFFKGIAFDPEFAKVHNNKDIGTAQKLERYLEVWSNENNPAQEKFPFKKMYCLYDPPGIAAEKDFLSALTTHETYIDQLEKLANTFESKLAERGETRQDQGNATRRQLSQEFTDLQKRLRTLERENRTGRREKTRSASQPLSDWDSASDAEKEATRKYKEARGEIAANPPPSPSKHNVSGQEPGFASQTSKTIPPLRPRPEAEQGAASEAAPSSRKPHETARQSGSRPATPLDSASQASVLTQTSATAKTSHTRGPR